MIRITNNGKEREITAIYRDGKTFTNVYFAERLVWQAIRSCFGRGYWINEKPWINNDGWKN